VAFFVGVLVAASLKLSADRRLYLNRSKILLDMSTQDSGLGSVVKKPVIAPTVTTLYSLAFKHNYPNVTIWAH